jgi:hypothetical protein
MQVVTAELVFSAGSVPPAVASALRTLLTGNVKKVLISMALWLPYLLLSKRVNVTYRRRVPASRESHAPSRNSSQKRNEIRALDARRLCRVNDNSSEIGTG